MSVSSWGFWMTTSRYLLPLWWVVSLGWACRRFFQWPSSKIPTFWSAIWILLVSLVFQSTTASWFSSSFCWPNRARPSEWRCRKRTRGTESWKLARATPSWLYCYKSICGPLFRWNQAVWRGLLAFKTYNLAKTCLGCFRESPKLPWSARKRRSSSPFSRFQISSPPWFRSFSWWSSLVCSMR